MYPEFTDAHQTTNVESWKIIQSIKQGEGDWKLRERRCKGSSKYQSRCAKERERRRGFFESDIMFVHSRRFGGRGWCNLYWFQISITRVSNEEWLKSQAIMSGGWMQRREERRRGRDPMRFEQWNDFYFAYFKLDSVRGKKPILGSAAWCCCWLEAVFNGSAFAPLYQLYDDANASMVPSGENVQAEIGLEKRSLFVRRCFL